MYWAFVELFKKASSYLTALSKGDDNTVNRFDN